MSLKLDVFLLIVGISVAEGRRIDDSPKRAQVDSADLWKTLAARLAASEPASAFNTGFSGMPGPRGDVANKFADKSRVGQPLRMGGNADSKPTGLVWPSPEAEKQVRKADGITLYPTHAWADNMSPVVEAKNTMLSTPFIVGVAADSGCGKSTFLKRIMGALGTQADLSKHTAVGESMTVVCLDDYHINDRAGRKATGLTALDAKENDFALMGAQMAALKEKKAVNKPIYNHDTGFKDEPELVEPNDLMIFEGLHPIYDETARKQLDLSIYIDIVNDVKFAWKVQRDVAERGWTEAQVKEDIEKRLPDFSEYVDPQKNAADIILRYEPSDKGLPNLKVKLIQVGAIRQVPSYKGHPGFKEKFQNVQLIQDELNLKYATLKSYNEPWGDYPYASVLEMDGLLDKDNMAAELQMIEDALAGLQTNTATELTDSMMALKDSPGSLDGTGVFQNVIALQVRSMYESNFENSFKATAKQAGIEIPLGAVANEKSLDEQNAEEDKKSLMLDAIRNMIADKQALEIQEEREKNPDLVGGDR